MKSAWPLALGLEDLVNPQLLESLWADSDPAITEISRARDLWQAPPEWGVCAVMRYRKNSAWGRIHTDLPGCSHWGSEPNCQWSVLATSGTTRLRFWRPDQVRLIEQPQKPQGMSEEQWWRSNPHIMTFLALARPEEEYTLDAGTAWLIFTSRPHQAWGGPNRIAYKLVSDPQTHGAWPAIVERFKPWIQ